MKLTSVLIVFLFVFISCKKDDPLPAGVNVDESDDDLFLVDTCDTVFIDLYVNDTIFPSDYLMTYPGSWWEYSDGSIRSSDEWRLISIVTTTKPNCYETVKNHYYLPNYGYGWIYQNSRVSNNLSENSSASAQLVGSNVGEVFYEKRFYSENPNDPSNSRVTLKYSHHYDSLEVEGNLYTDVQVVRYTYALYKGGVLMSISQQNEQFYAKEVGLIREVRITMGWDFDTINLIDHHIEPY